MAEVIANHTGKTKSYWMEVKVPSYSPLSKDVVTDVCVVGGGIAGLTCAYTLAKQGKQVVVLEKGRIGGGETARTTGHLAWALDDRYYDLIDYFGEHGAKIAAESHAAAIDYIETIVQEERIDCDFERVKAYLFLGEGDKEEVIDQELAALRQIGRDVTKSKKPPLPFMGPTLHYPKHAEFHVLKYLKGLAQAFINAGGKIYTHTHVKEIHDETPCMVKTEGANVTAQAVIVATCTPINDRVYMHTKQSAYRTYVIGARIPKNAVPKGLYWDTLDPYHYIRTASEEDCDWLLIGGEDHRVGQDSDPIEKFVILEKWARLRFPIIDKINYQWSGQIFEPVDSLAFIGRNPGDKHVYIATGDSGNGLTHGTIAGLLIPDLILGRPNPWEDLYDPSRKTLKAAKEFIEENANTLAQYRDWLTPGDLKQIEDLPVDQGMILRSGAQKLAVYKDKHHKVHIHSAFCPHLGGCVRWNDCEKTWDCPAHGSRFEATGETMTGPAIGNLEKQN
jgi:glycine/D-amino acid oxidase-like deaminating enzyme/nitrite reductase/ring-hydroxylating ferredoxin subunit